MKQAASGLNHGRTRYAWVIVLLLILVYVWALAGVPFTGFKETAAQIMKAIVAGIFSPDWNFVYLPEGEDLLRGLLDTLAISVLDIRASLEPCSVSHLHSRSARNMSGHRSISGAGKMVLSFIRTFPEIIMALLFIKAVGPGSFAGVLTPGLHSIGMFGELYADEVENIDYGPSGSSSCRTNRMQQLWFAILPQVMPGFLNYTLYRFEINVRSATILGVIGRGYRSTR